MFPGPTDRTIIVGSNGSGKTQFAVWLLSTRNYHDRPWIIFDFKHDELIKEIGATEVSVYKDPPTKPGLYVVRPMPVTDDDAVNVYMLKIWRNEQTGVYIDEGYMVPKESAQYRALLTQGRSKQIEMIILSQRPVRMDRFTFSEGTYFAIFRLTDNRDRKTVKEMVPVNLDRRLLPFHCYWYSVRDNTLNIMRPVPKSREIIRSFTREKRGELVSI